MKNLATNTTHTHTANTIVAGNGVTTLGTGLSTAHVSVSIQFFTHSVSFLVYPYRQVKHTLSEQVSHPVGHRTQLFPLTSYWKDIVLQSK